MEKFEIYSPKMIFIASQKIEFYIFFSGNLIEYEFLSFQAGEQSDTKYLWNKLQEASEKGLSVTQVFSSIRGPYSFVYYEK